MGKLPNVKNNTLRTSKFMYLLGGLTNHQAKLALELLRVNIRWA